MAKVIIFGAGRGAITAYKYLKHDTDHEIIAFTINQEYINNHPDQQRTLLDETRYQ